METVIVASEKSHFFCHPPYTFLSYGWLTTEYPEGSYWSCPDCGQWWKSVGYAGLIPCNARWRKVRWFNFTDKSEIKRKGH
jgi:hypothetical protein